MQNGYIDNSNHSHHNEENEEETNHSRYAKRYYLNLDYDERKRRNRRIPRLVLVEPKMSAWKKILSSGNDQSLITTTGLDFNVFKELKQRFEPEYSRYSLVPIEGKYVKVKDKSGRRRLINGEDCLGLVLVWSRTRGSLAFLQVIFGLSRTGVEVYLRFGKRLLIKLLSRDVNSKIGTPNRCRVESYMEAVREMHPALEGVGLSMDGLRLSSEAPGSFVAQNNYYNCCLCFALSMLLNSFFFVRRVEANGECGVWLFKLR